MLLPRRTNRSSERPRNTPFEQTRASVQWRNKSAQPPRPTLPPACPSPWGGPVAQGLIQGLTQYQSRPELLSPFPVQPQQAALPLPPEEAFCTTGKAAPSRPVLRSTRLPLRRSTSKSPRIVSSQSRLFTRLESRVAEIRSAGSDPILGLLPAVPFAQRRDVGRVVPAMPCIERQGAVERTNTRFRVIQCSRKIRGLH